MANEIREIKDMLQKHIDKSDDFREKMMAAVTKIETTAEHDGKRLTLQEEKITIIEKAHDRQKGALWALGVIWSALLAFIGLSKS